MLFFLLKRCFHFADEISGTARILLANLFALRKMIFSINPRKDIVGRKFIGYENVTPTFWNQAAVI